MVLLKNQIFSKNLDKKNIYVYNLIVRKNLTGEETMLKEITIKNYKSFNDEVTFSMEADVDRVSEHPDHVVKIADNSLLKVASVYGPNGGGKSNLISALLLPVATQLDRQSFLGNELPCVFSNSNDMEETIYFADDDYEIGYRFIVRCLADMDERSYDPYLMRFNQIQNHLEFLEEGVFYRKKGEKEYFVLCERNADGEIIGNDFLCLFENKDFKLAKTKSIVRYTYDTFANNDSLVVEPFIIIRNLFTQLNSIVPLQSNSPMVVFPILRIRVKKHANKLVKLLNDLDIKISDIKVYEKKPGIIFFERKVIINGKEVEKELPLSSESEGTQKIFWLLVNTLDRLHDGKIFLCDDMNAYLHPKLFKAFVKLFQENKTKSQLIFNSHDILNMSNDLFRRDEIWFAYRDDNYSTKLVPLSNIVNYKGEQVRKDATYSKQYLEGRYGADPFIARGLSWNE